MYVLESHSYRKELKLLKRCAAGSKGTFCHFCLNLEKIFLAGK